MDGVLPTAGDQAGIQNLPNVLQAADDNGVIAVSEPSQGSDCAATEFLIRASVLVLWSAAMEKGLRPAHLDDVQTGGQAKG